jgi:hypothetical protein
MKTGQYIQKLIGGKGRTTHYFYRNLPKAAHISYLCMLHDQDWIANVFTVVSSKTLVGQQVMSESEVE